MKSASSSQYIDAVIFEADLEARREIAIVVCDQCEVPAPIVALVIFLTDSNSVNEICSECYAELLSAKVGDLV